MRKRDAEKTVIFRVPADWQQEGESFTFKGPHDALLKLLVQKAPEGYPLDDYFAATLQAVRDRSAGDDSVTRRTQFQNVDAREMVLEVVNRDSELMRSVAWLTIYGPHAFFFNLQVPAAHAAEVEPYFKAVVQSVSFSSDSAFEDLRAAAIKSPALAKEKRNELLEGVFKEIAIHRDPPPPAKGTIETKRQRKTHGIERYRTRKACARSGNRFRRFKRSKRATRRADPAHIGATGRIQDPIRAHRRFESGIADRSGAASRATA